MPPAKILRCILLLFFMLPGFPALAQYPAGYTVKHFTNENGLPQNSVKSLAFDKRGFLWIATEMGLVRFDGVNFKTYNQANFPAMHSNRILQVKAGPDSSMYFATEGSRFFRVGWEGTLTKASIPPAMKDWERQVDNHLYDVYDELEKRCQQGQLPYWVLPDYASISRSVYNSMYASGARYYYFNKDAELISLDSSLTDFRKVQIRGAVLPPKPFHVSMMSQQSDGWMSIGTVLYKIATVEAAAVALTPVVDIGNIPNPGSVAIDPETGMIVLGTLSDGFYLFARQPFHTLLLPDVESNVFYALAPFGDGGFISKKAAFEGGRILPVKWGYTSEPLLRTRSGSFLLNRWLSHDDAGIVELDSNLTEKEYTRIYDLRINCLQQFRDGSIWLSTKRQFIGKLERGYIHWEKRPAGVAEQFKITSFLEDSEGAVWLAGTQGLLKWDRATNQYQAFPALNGISVRSLYEDERKNIWIGTYGKGFYCWRGSGTVLQALPLDQHEYLLSAHCFIPDRSGGLWISTNRGLFYTKKQDLWAWLDNHAYPLYYHYFDKTAGFLSNEFNGGCTPPGATLSDGSIVLPSTRGVVKFHPDSVPISFSRNPIYIDQVRMGKKLITAGDLDVLEVDKSAGFLEFDISSPYFGNRENNFVEYQVPEFSAGWIPVPENNRIILNKLSSGHYSLLFRKRAGFGKDGLITRSFELNVLPFFYETWWFRVTALAVLGALIWLAFRMRLNYLLKQKKHLEKLVAERTQEQSLLIDDLEQTVTELEASKEKIRRNNLFRQQLAMIIAHDLQSPLRFLAQTADWVSSNYAADRQRDYTPLLKEISNTSKANHHFINDIGYWIRSMGTDFVPDHTPFNLKELVRGKIEFLSPLARERNNTIEVEVAPDLELRSDRQLLRVMLRNLLDNANKFTRNGTISIHASSGPEGASISIRDTGCGMRPAVLQEIRQRLQDPGDGEPRYQARGNGFLFIATFARLLELEVEVESEWGKGTSVVLRGIAIYRQTTYPLNNKPAV